MYYVFSVSEDHLFTSFVMFLNLSFYYHELPDRWTTGTVQYHINDGYDIRISCGVNRKLIYLKKIFDG